MAYGTGNKLEKKKPLYFFYDCQATGLDLKEDRIIEVASVIHLASLKPATRMELTRSINHEFSSLCYCDREVGEEAQKLTKLTSDDLKDEPPLEDVLKRFFEWMEVSIATARRLDHEEYTPVLVAHGGNALDFPLLNTEVDRLPSLQTKFHTLNLRYVDTFSVFADLKRNEKLDVDKLSLKAIYEDEFFMIFEGHRALPDAKGLCKIFTEATIAPEINLFLKYIQNREEMLAMQERVEKFRKVSIGVFKTVELLAGGITYEVMAREYQRSPRTFKTFLENECKIRNLEQQQKLIGHLSV